MNIGNRLKIAREAIGYKQGKVCEISGIGKSSISEFENSTREPSFSQLRILADVYKKSLDYFFSDEELVDVMLWRDAPEDEINRKETEAEFLRLCEQYRRLELCTKEVVVPKLPKAEEIELEKFTYKHAGDLAQKVQKELVLGDIPSSSLKQILEENYHVKIFHLSFDGSAVSTYSQIFGPAILLKKQSKLWRRNFDLAHELFHLLTWKIFRSGEASSISPTETEEKLANAFASRLLLPTDSVKNRIDSIRENDSNIKLEDLDEVAREFGVSLEALLWRLVYLYNINTQVIEKHVSRIKLLNVSRPERLSDTPDELPERYCSLAIKALREGNLSLMQFSKYMRLSYKKAQAYLMEEEELTDEEVSISLA